MRRAEIHRDGSLLVQGRAHLDGAGDGRAELVLRAELSRAEHRIVLARGQDGQADDFDAAVTVSTLAGAEGETNVWDAYIALDGAGEERLGASADARLAPASVTPEDASLYRVRPYLRHQGHLSLAVTRLAPHAEVLELVVEDEAVDVHGFLPRPPAESSVGARLAARRRGTDSEVSAPATVEGDRFSARLDLGDLLHPSNESDVWDLRLEVPGAGTLRLGAHLDDVRDKKNVLVYPPRTLSRESVERRLRPYFTVENNLSIRSRPVKPKREEPALPSEPPTPSPQPETPERPSSPRRRLERMLAAVLEDVARRVIRSLGDGGRALRLPRAKSRRRERPKIHIVILHGYGMGGTIRTVINLAGYLAEHYEVELISVFRGRRVPAFAIPHAVEVTVLDDRVSERPSRLLRWLHRVLSTRPSVLMHRDDYGHRACSLWTDLMLAWKIRSLRSGVLITTRPALNLIAARAAPPGLTTIGQEHQNFHAHRPGLAAAIGREYAKLDALAVLTHDDLNDYGEMLASAPTRVVRITNALPPDLEGDQAALDTKMVVAGGRLTYQKGFDRMIPAFAPVARRHPEWKLRIYGGGKKRGQLQRLILEHDLYNNVFLMGPTDRLGEELLKGAVFALTSRYEGFGMVLIEAMSKGLGVVSFDCPRGPSEIISPGQDGILVPEGDVAGFSDALLEVIEDEDKRRRFGRAALEKAKAYDISVIGREWDRLFEELTSRAGARASSSYGVGD